MGSIVKVWVAEGTVSDALLRKGIVELANLPGRDALFLMHGCLRSAVLESERSAQSWTTRISKPGRTNRNIRCGVEEPEVMRASKD